MKIKRLPDEKKMVEAITSFISIDNEKIKIPNDFDELIDSLNSADGFGSAVMIYNKILADQLIKVGLVKQNIRGSYYGTSKLNTHYKELLHKIYEIPPEL